jgi:shikimate dehydrogenase
MKLYGLIGYPLSHSFSKNYFEEKFTREHLSDYRYENFPLQSLEELTRLIKDTPELQGFNVTIPYKEKVLPCLDRIDENSFEIGAVNTVKIDRQQRKPFLKGYNTDSYGFYTSLIPFLNKNVTDALILGTGGAAKAVASVLKKMGISCLFVSRHPMRSDHISYADLCGPVLYHAQLIVNTTPVGMVPDTDACPDIPYEFITGKHLLYDLIYNPEETKFLARGKQWGARVVNGLAMLSLQAEKAWDIWNDDRE